MSSKRYPGEFKIEAVEQVTDRGHSVAEVASRLGTTTHSLYAWIKRYGPDSAEHQAKADEQAEAVTRPYVSVAPMLEPDNPIFYLRISNTGKTSASKLKTNHRQIVP